MNSLAVRTFCFMRLQVCVLTPDRIFRNEEAEELILPTSTGQIGILKGHAPLITALDIGPIVLCKKSNWSAIALIGGFGLVQQNQVTILVNDALSASSVDRKSTENELAESLDRLNQVTGEKAKVEATFAFKRARARYQIVNWKKLYNLIYLFTLWSQSFYQIVILS
jgi:ATP synthase F1 epsilon subunit